MKPKADPSTQEIWNVLTKQIQETWSSEEEQRRRKHTLPTEDQKDIRESHILIDEDFEERI